MDKFEKELLLGKYKSAYSPVYDEFVRIVKTRIDDNNKLIIDTIIPSNKRYITSFKISELEDYEKM